MSEPNNLKVGEVFFVISTFDTMGGAQTLVAALANNAATRYQNVTLITGAVSEKVIRSQLVDTVKVSHLPGLHNGSGLWLSLIALWRLFRLFADQGSSALVNCHSSKAGFITQLAAKFTKVRCVFCAHGWSFTKGVPPVRRSVCYVLELALRPFRDVVVLTSKFDMAYGVSAKVVAQKRCVLIENGRTLGLAVGSQSAATNTPLIMLMIARFCEAKNHTLIIRALSALNRQGVNLPRVRFVGGGDNKAEKCLAEELGIIEHVDFVGELTDVTGEYESCDIFALASHWEGQPLTLLEAMEAGKPILCSDVCGNSELVRRGCGYALKNVEHIWAEKIQALCEDSDLRQALAGRSRAAHELHYNERRMVRNYLLLFSVLQAST